VNTDIDSGSKNQPRAGARRSATAIAASTLFVQPPVLYSIGEMKMLSINDRKNHTRQLLRRTWATAFLTNGKIAFVSDRDNHNEIYSMKKMTLIFIGVVLLLTATSAISLAQSASLAGSDQQTNPPQAGVRIFINDRLLSENAVRARPAPPAPPPVPIPYPNRKESDPTPFPVTGEIYISVVDLAAAINGHHELEPHLKIEGAKLYASRRPHIGKPKYEDWLAVNSDGLISSALRELKGEDGEQKLYVPLNDLVKALGGEVHQTEVSSK
jgi:hypothetical protein